MGMSSFRRGAIGYAVVAKDLLCNSFSRAGRSLAYPRWGLKAASPSKYIERSLRSCKVRVMPGRIYRFQPTIIASKPRELFGFRRRGSGSLHQPVGPTIANGIGVVA